MRRASFRITLGLLFVCAFAAAASAAKTPAKVPGKPTSPITVTLVRWPYT